MSSNPVERLAEGAKARREHRFDDAYLAYMEAAEALRLDQGARGHYITALAGLGQVESDRGRLGEARQYYVEALAVARKEGLVALVAHLARHVGDLSRRMGAIEEAEALLLESLSHYRGHLDTTVLELANAIRPLALLRVAQGHTRDAVELWREARTLYGAINVTAGVEECSIRLRELELLLGASSRASGVAPESSAEKE